MLIVIDGGLGSGKSYTAVALATEMAAARGLPLGANFPLVGGTYLTSWRDFMSWRDGILIWDEAHQDIDSREFSKNVAITPWLTQIRKLGVDLFVVSQDIGQLDKRLRNLADRLLRCEPIVEGAERGTKLYVVDLFTMRLTNTVVIRHSPSVYARYATRKLIRPFTGRPLTIDELDVLDI